jgi:hypothetical protein
VTSIGGIRFAELATHPLFLHAELDPEREEDENENDEPAHLGDRNRHAKKPCQNAGVDGVTDHAIGTGSNQLVALLNCDGARKSAREYDICGLQCCGCILTVPMKYLKGRICSGHALEWRRC